MTRSIRSSAWLPGWKLDAVSLLFFPPFSFRERARTKKLEAFLFFFLGSLDFSSSRRGLVAIRPFSIVYSLSIMHIRVYEYTAEHST